MKPRLQILSLSLVVSACSTDLGEGDKQSALDPGSRHDEDAGSHGGGSTSQTNASDSNIARDASSDSGTLEPQGPLGPPNVNDAAAGVSNMNTVTGDSATNSNTVCVGNGNIVSNGDVVIVGDNHVISGRDTIGCAGQTRLLGDGKLVTEMRSVNGFQEVHVGERFHVELQVGSPSLVVELDSNLIGLVDTVVRDGALQIKTRQPSTELVPSAQARILITVPSLSEVESAGASSVTGAVTGDALTLSANGAGSIDVSVSANSTLNVEASGSGAVSIRGTGALLQADLGGSSSLKSAVAHRAVEVTAAGASSASVHAEASAKVDAAGASRVEIVGAPAQREVNATPAASVTFRN